MGERRLAGDDLGADVDIEKRVDVDERDVLELTQTKDARIVDEDVEAPSAATVSSTDASTAALSVWIATALRPFALIEATTSAARSADFS